MKSILYTLLTLALLLAIAAGGLYCIRLGIDIGRKAYSNTWACTTQRNKKGNLTGMICKIEEKRRQGERDDIH